MIARLERFTLRFLTCYFLLYGPVVLSTLGFAGLPPYWYDRLWQGPVRALGNLAGLHLSPVVPPTPSSDAFQAVQIVLFVLIAAVAAIIWSAVERGSSDPSIRSQPRGELMIPFARENDRIYQWLRIGMRYLLGYAMIHFGIAVLFRFQFPSPALEGFVTPLADLEPYEMLSAWMGWSPIYTSYLGVIEIIGGALLFNRKTTLLGALWAGIVLSNVVQLNFLFDVPGKSLAPHFTLITGLLILPDLLRVAQLHVFGGAVQPADLGLRVPGGFLRRNHLAVKSLVVVLCVLSPIASITMLRGALIPPRSHALAGLYDIQSYQRDGEPFAPLVGDSVRWRYAILSSDAKILHVQTMDGVWTAFNSAIDTVTRKVMLSGGRPGDWRTASPRSGKGIATDTLRLLNDAPGQLHLAGSFIGHHLDVTLERVDMERFKLLAGNSF